MTKHKVRIVFKGGVVQDVQCENFTIRRDEMNQLSVVSWVGCKPEILTLRLEEIAAVFKIV